MNNQEIIKSEILSKMQGHNNANNTAKIMRKMSGS